MGSFFDLQVHSREIFAYDTQAEQLDASDKSDDTGCRSPARDRVSKKEFADHDKGDRQKGDHGHQDPEPGSDVQRYMGKIDDAVDRVSEQAPEIPFGLACDPFHIFIGHPVGAEADPAKDSF